ncbi:hypothetical protein K3495_g2446 [Podosphaera aphanis]|nr:hypothetical protein K3495_g2446 [Podosphaera aphanis]
MVQDNVGPVRKQGVTHVLEKPLTEYAAIATPDKCARVDAKVEAIIQEDIKTLNYEKKEKYLKDAGTVNYLLLKGLNDDDQSFLDEYQIPKELWAHLKSKYSKTSQLAAAQYVRDLNNFEFQSDMTIDSARKKLKEIRGKIISTKSAARAKYDEALMMILISALPKSYQTTIDSMSIHENLPTEVQLTHLETKRTDSGSRVVKLNLPMLPIDALSRQLQM